WTIAPPAALADRPGRAMSSLGHVFARPCLRQAMAGLRTTRSARVRPAAATPGGSDCPLLPQPCEVTLGNAKQRAEQLIGVLAKQRRAAYRDRRLRQFERAADGLVGAAPGVGDIDDHLARPEVRISEHLARVLAGAAGDTGCPHAPHDLVLGQCPR